MRTFQETHPWLRFRLDLGGFDPALWLALGEIKSKCDHVAGVPLKRATAQSMLRLYLAKGAAATTAIEGNTLTEAEVLSRLEGTLQLPPSREYLGVEVDNVLAACNELAGRLDSARGLEPLDPAGILRFNGAVLKGLDLPTRVEPGVLRTYPVGVGRYLGPPHEDCAHLLERLCAWLGDPAFAAGLDLPPVVLGFLKAVLAHLYIAWIHPFGDGNGRTARMVELRLLLEAGVPQPAAHLLSNHYNQTRTRYYQELENASLSGGDPVPFIRYSAQGFLDGLVEQLDFIRGQQWELTWLDYVDTLVAKRGGNLVQLRQRRLMRAISAHSGPVAVAGLATLNPEVARDYATRSPKALSRDLNELVGLGLLALEKGRVRALKERILAFLPRRAGQTE